MYLDNHVSFNRNVYSELNRTNTYTMLRDEVGGDVLHPFTIYQLHVLNYCITLPKKGNLQLCQNSQNYQPHQSFEQSHVESHLE